jgi:hypothetical protein
MIELDVFFRAVRKNPFGGSLTKGQVEGMEQIIGYWQQKHRDDISLDQMAYILATIFHETNRKMVPVKEAGSEQYLRSKRYFPNIGVGLIQITWAQNWKRWNIKSLEDGLSWPIALRATFEGMLQGAFTGKRLTDYIGNGRRDFVGARRIINGTDRAQMVAGYAEDFRVALRQANMPDATGPLADYQEPATPDFKEWLLAALRDDEEIREAILEVVFPSDDGSNSSDPQDAPHDQYGPEYAEADAPDERYG